MRARGVLAAVGIGAAAVVACAMRPAASTSGPLAALPEGPGRAILVGQCLACHELDALALFRDYYGRQQWRALILTMRKNGAVLDDGQVDVLADYLSMHFGTED